jgi:hypothetical protein
MLTRGRLVDLRLLKLTRYRKARNEMMLTGAFALAGRMASVPSAMARSKSPVVRQITARWISGVGSAGLTRMASLMSASAVEIAERLL